MNKSTRRIGLLLAVVVMCIGTLGLLSAPPVSAAGECWQVDCNTCCRTAKGRVICTQRACP
jgi:hypothetical protein